MDGNSNYYQEEHQDSSHKGTLTQRIMAFATLVISAVGPVSVFHPAISRAWRTWMALASCPARQGQQRSLRRMPQVLSWALARSPTPRRRAWARLAAFCEGGLLRPL